MEAALQKYLRYWGPRYQVAPIEIAVEGEWAHGVARWRGESKTLSGPIHILAHRLPDGTWQALMPGTDGLYLQWLEAVPENLVLAGEKTQLRTQAVEADTSWRPQAAPAVPPAMTAMPPGREEAGRQPIEPTPVPSSLESASSVTWSVEGDRSVIYAITNEGTRMKVVDVPFDEMLLPQFSVFITLSPDGQHITYVTADNLAMHNARLWLVDLGSNSRRLLATFPYDFWIAPLVWSPDGTRIAFTKVTTPSLTSSGIELWTLNVQSGEQTMLVSDPSFRPELFRIGSLPVVRWSLDGTNVTYTDYTARDGFMTEYEVSLASGVIRSSRYPLGAVEQSQLSILATLPCGVTQFSQNDPEWRTDVMQTCGLTIGAAGCAVTSVAMTFRYYAVETSPRTLNQCLGNSACPIYWGTAASSCSGGKTSYLGSPGFAWSTVESNLSAGRPVIVELNGGNGRYHYVVVVSGSGGSGSGYTIIDPWDGQVRSLAAYTDNGWTPTGLRIYGGTPWCQGSTCDATGIPSGYTKCAEEGGRCNFGGTQQVYYGANSCYKVKSFTNGVDCNNNNFGDPLPGVHKACYVSASSSSCDATSLPSGYVKCAGENGYCSFSGTQQVYYGANSCYKVKTFTNGVGCNNGNFGDPLPGVSKSCYVPPTCNPNADQVALYANTGWGGYCVTLGVGDYPNPGHLGSVGNDNTESIRVGSNVQAILYEHDNYQGRSETFTNDDPNLGDNYIGANSVSSVKVQWRVPAPPQLQAPVNGYVFNEGTPINLAWSSTGNEYFGEVWGGPGGTLTFGWQGTPYKNLGPQWAGYTYSWHVKARNSAGESGWSSTWTFTVKPSAPSNLSAQTASCSQVNLYWTDNSGNEEGYKIYRNGSYVGQVGMNATSYQDTGLSGNTSYSYYVRAFRGNIESDASNTVNITTPSCPPPKPDLRPYAPSGYPYPVVPSSITSTHEVNTLIAGQSTYFDWHFINSGGSVAPATFYVELWVDDTRYVRYPQPDFYPGWVGGFDDWAETILTPGWHTVRLITDPDNTVAESDETNNVWEQEFYWVPNAPYFDDMEGSGLPWAATGLWHLVESSYIGHNGSSHAYWYGQDATGNYDTGTANFGDLTSPPIYIPTTGYYLRFWYRYETETQGPDWDQRWVQISVDGGPFYNVMQLSDDPMMWWLQSPAIDLSGYAGHAIKVRFHFNTIDGQFNNYRGWYIDDFSISTTPPPSCADSHEPNNTPAQSTAIAYGQALSADICPGGDYDFYRFSGIAGDRVVIDIDASANSSWLDPYIFLIDTDGNRVLSQNDDEILGEVTDSHLGYQLPHNGIYYIKVKAWNHPSVGGTNYFYTIRLLTDDTNPSSAVITSPSNNAWLHPVTETITVVATDDESGINRVEFLWHDADWQNSEWIWLGADQDGRDGWSWNFSTNGLPDQQGGAFYIWAFDWAGNWTGAGVWNLGIDRTPSTVDVGVSPMYGNAPFRDFYVWWYGSDNLSGIASYNVQYRDGSGGIWTDLLTDTTDTIYHFVGQNGHTYYFRAQAYDYAGNLGNSNEISHTVQTCVIAADPYETDNVSANARLIEANAKWQIHNFHIEGDQDWVKFIALPGITYTLVTTNTGGHADTVIYLYDRDGSTLIAYNDDDPENWPASRLIWQPLVAGMYYIKIEHWDPYAYGCTTAYGLSITPDRSISHIYLPIILKSR